MPTFSTATSLPGRIAGGDDGEGRRRGIARHGDVAALSSGQPTTRDALAAAAFDRRHAHLGAEMAQHALGVVARGLGLDHRGLARAC